MKTMLPVLFFTLFCAPLYSLAGGPPAPILDFDASQTVGCQTLTTTFTDWTFSNSGDGFILYVWDFGDGTVSPSSNTPVISHTYASPGKYSVTMSVVTQLGNNHTLTIPNYITVGSNFSVNLGSDITTCAGTAVLLNATTAGATYLWSQSSTSATISTLLSGTISVIVTNDGCVAKDTIAITRDPLLTANFTYSTAGGCSPIKTDFTQTSSACGGTVTGWEWDFGDGLTSSVMNPSHDYLSPGTYTVLLKVTKSDLTTFTVSKSVIVTGFQTPVVELGADQILCDGSALDLAAGNPGADYNWSTGETTADITVYDGGMYYLTVTKDGCSTDDSVKVTLKPELWSDFSFVKGSGCMPVNYQFTDASSSCSGTITDWLWQFGDGTTSIEQNPLHAFTSDGAFTVRLTITDNNFNTTVRSRKVTVAPVLLPSVNLGIDTTICFGDFITFDAANAGATYLWSTGETTQQITVFDDGVYSVIVTVGGCEGKDTVVMTTAASVVAAWGYTSTGTCLPVAVNFKDSSVALCGQSVVSWNWDFGDGTASTLQNPAHSYATANNFNVRLLITSSNGNTSTKTKKVTVTNTIHSIAIADAVKVCVGGSTVLDALVTGGQYAWTPALGLSDYTVRNPTLSPVSNRWYKVAVTKCMVTVEDSIYVTLDSMAKPVISQQKNTLIAQDAASYKWYLEGKRITNAAGKNIRVTTSGYYTVTTFNGLGCENTSVPFYFIPLADDDKAGEVKIVCTPNPTTGIFNILLAALPSKAARVTVYDAVGKRMMVTSVQDHVNRLDITRFAKGLYFLEIVVNSKRKIIPIVLQ